MTVYFEYWRKSIQGAVLIEILFRKRGLGSSGTETLIPTNVRTSPHGLERLLERGRARGNNYLRGCTCRRGLSGYFTTTTMTMTETMGRLLRLTNAAARHLADVLSATSTARRVSRGRSGSARRCPSSTPDGPDGGRGPPALGCWPGRVGFPVRAPCGPPNPSGLGRRRSKIA